MINTTMTALAVFYAPAQGNANSTSAQTAAREDRKTGATVEATGASSGSRKSGSTPPTPTRSGSASGITTAREGASAASAKAEDGKAETSEDMPRDAADAAQTRMKTDLLIKSMPLQSQSQNAGAASQTQSQTPQALAVSAYMENGPGNADASAEKAA